MLNRFIFTALIAFILAFSPAFHAQAQQPSAKVLPHAQNVAKYCIGSWTRQTCLASVSDASMLMSTEYAASLKQAGKMNAFEKIKEHCAASTAAANGELPAKAMRSAYVECANIIVDTNDATGMGPDASLYQILVSAVLCLDGNPACSAVEKGFSRFR